MKNYLILVHYRAPMEVVEQHTPEHRAYLRTQYDAGRLLFSGPFVPRTAAVFWAQAASREEIDSMLEADPFSRHKVVEFEVHEFNPVLYAEQLEPVFAAQKEGTAGQGPFGER